ncbi:MAG: nucleotide-diphospho-sugar transferase [Candidatus Iainarchaeum sp.]|jgi:hypothetical protein
MTVKVPVLFLIFNRLDTTKQVFGEIRKVEPKKLYIGADGPRNREEKLKTDAVRKFILDNIDWNCEVKTLFRKKNLGCGRAVSSAINWFFKHEEMGIILEDDCFPNPSFFSFCEDLLDKYADNEQIMYISGNNFQYNGGVKVKESYFFSKYSHIWGWATWRRAWKKHDFKMKNWPKAKSDSKFNNLFDSKEEKERFYWWFDQMKLYPFSTWDVQWVFTLWSNNGLAIYPNKNLVKNIGFSNTSTNTQVSRGFILQTPLESMSKKLIHPKEIKRNVAADKVTFNRWFKRGLVLKVFDILSPNLKKYARKIYSIFLKLRYKS